VLTCSGLTGLGIDGVWDAVHRHRAALGPAGLADKRSAQRWELTWALVRDELDQRLRRSAAVADTAARVRPEVLAGTLPAPAAADALLRAFDERA
jgi:LAO/AO transport system kinase